MRWILRILLCALAALTLAAGLRGIGGVSIAQAAGRASCGVAVAKDVALGGAGSASVRLSRAQGVAGTALTLTGSRWPANTAVTVDVYLSMRGVTYFALRDLAEGATAADGSLSIPNFRAPAMASCVLPEGADGETAQFLVHTLDDRTRAPATFTYLTALGPQVTTTPFDQALDPGTQVSVTGARWEPGERMTITPAIAPWTMSLPQPTPLPLASATVTVTADSKGAFSITLPGLDEAPETRITFTVEGTGPRYGDVEVDSWGYIMLPKVFPSIHLSNIAVNPGGALTVSGDHWLPHQSGVIGYCRGESVIPGIVGLRCDPYHVEQLGAFQADGSGHFVAQVHLPTNARLGSVTIQARDPGAPFGLIVYAQAQPLAIAPTWAQAHPHLTRLLAAAPYLGGSAIALIALLVAALILIRRRRAQPS